MHPQNLEASLAEALAAFWAVKFCLEMGLQEVIFEGDSVQVITSIRDPLPHLSKFGHITESIVQELYKFRSASLFTLKGKATWPLIA